MSAFLFSAKITLNELYHHVDLALAQLPAKRHHSVSAFGDVLIDLLVGRIFERLLSKVRYLPSIFECLPFCFRAVADRAVLSKDRRFVSIAFRDRETLRS